MNFNLFWAEAQREHSIGRPSGGLLTAVNKKHSVLLIDASPWWILKEIKLGASTIILGILSTTSEQILYADDTVIFAHSHIDLLRKLRALKEYCDLNQLTVNKAKTKILVFKAAGRIRDCPCRYRTYKQSYLELVKSYTYLGVEISTSTRGLTALNSANNKAKCAAEAAMSLLAKAKCDSWSAHMKIYNCMVSSVFLYAIPAWGLWYRHSLEPAQTFFFKKLFKLPRNTPDWAVRLEFGLDPVALKAMGFILSWVIKTLKAKDNCLHKVCLLRLINLAKNTTASSPYNWATQLRDFLMECDALDLFDSLDHQLWEARRENILKKYQTILHSADITAARNSSSLEFPLQLPDSFSPAGYLALKLPLNCKRLIAQLRLSNKYNCFLIVNNFRSSFNRNSPCQLCNLKAPDTVEHLLVRCPCFSSFQTPISTKPAA
ncbi:Protein of unknown function [Cotesia congregata]|uniref:Reverse transcriptase domain-containing protein n=1 Tax=Cotesia congregata TaxID=51543 RepID=A0A8J2EJG2_COTCN|nr:Protein of unknown function [Cotesia congregata]